MRRVKLKKFLKPKIVVIYDNLQLQLSKTVECFSQIKETEAMMRRVMELLGRLVLDEVRRKTCASLAPDMRDFLQWSLGLEELEPLSDQVMVQKQYSSINIFFFL